MDRSNTGVLIVTSTRAEGSLTWAKSLFTFARVPQRNLSNLKLEDSVP